MESQNPLTEKGTNMSASGDSTNSRLRFCTENAMLKPR